MACQHKQNLSEYMICGLQGQLLLVTCPDCHTTLVHKEPVEHSEVFLALNEVALNMDSADLVACEFAIEVICVKATNAVELQFAKDLLDKVARETEIRNRKSAV